MKVADFSCCQLNRQGSAGGALGESGAMFSGVMGAGTSFATECTERERSAQAIMREVVGRVLDCPAVSCPVECELSPWSDLTPCDKACGGGEKSQGRYVLRHPANGGAPCGPTRRSLACNAAACEDAAAAAVLGSFAPAPAPRSTPRRAPRPAAAKPRPTLTHDGERDCVLSAWKPQHGCSSACQQLETRKVIRMAGPRGSCADLHNGGLKRAVPCSPCGPTADEHPATLARKAAGAVAAAEPSESASGITCAQRYRSCVLGAISDKTDTRSCSTAKEACEAAARLASREEL